MEWKSGQATSGGGQYCQDSIPVNKKEWVKNFDKAINILSELFFVPTVPAANSNLEVIKYSLGPVENAEQLVIHCPLDVN